MPDRVLVAVAHGSADPRAAATIGELMAVAARRARARGLNAPDLRIAYLGHAAPSLPQVMSTLGPGAPVTVLPLLLTAAYHSKTDIPRALARLGRDLPRLQVSYGAPLGPHPLLLRALERRMGSLLERAKASSSASSNAASVALSVCTAARMGMRQRSRSEPLRSS